MDLPTYTSIWRIEKRLYKLYDFRLPMPVPVGQIAVFAAITVPYVILLTILGLPFNHTLFWLYVLPPGVITWLATRPVLESKRLPELVISQVRYLGEPGIWCRMAPLAEKDDVVVVGKVWRRDEERTRLPAEAPSLAPAPGRRPAPAPARVRPAARKAAATQTTPGRPPARVPGAAPAQRPRRKEQGGPAQWPVTAAGSVVVPPAVAAGTAPAEIAHDERQAPGRQAAERTARQAARPGFPVGAPGPPGNGEGVASPARPDGAPPAARPAAAWPVKDPHAPASPAPGAPARPAWTPPVPPGEVPPGPVPPGPVPPVHGDRGMPAGPAVPPAAHPVPALGGPVPALGDPVQVPGDPVPVAPESMAGHAETLAVPDTAVPAPPAGPAVSVPAQAAPPEPVIGSTGGPPGFFVGAVRPEADEQGSASREPDDDRPAAHEPARDRAAPHEPAAHRAAEPKAAAPEVAEPKAAEPGVTGDQAPGPGSAGNETAGSKVGEPGETQAQTEAAGPGAVDDEITEPEAVESGAAEPKAAAPEVAEPGAVEGHAAQGEAAEPGVADPEGAHDETAAPETAEPAAGEPEVAEPHSGEQRAAADEVAQPEMAGPEVAEAEARPGAEALGPEAPAEDATLVSPRFPAGPGAADEAGAPEDIGGPEQNLHDEDQAGEDQAGEDQAGEDQAGEDQAGEDQAGDGDAVDLDPPDEAAATAGSPPPAPSPWAPPVVVVRGESSSRPTMVERALSGPGQHRAGNTWREHVRVVPGGDGPGRPDMERRDRARVLLPIHGPRLIVVLGCTVGAGQTVTTLMLADVLASLRGEPVAALDLNPGQTSLTDLARTSPADTARGLLAGARPTVPGQRGRGRLDLIAHDSAPDGGPALGDEEYARVLEILASRYPLTLTDPGASAVARVLSAADQLVLVAPASADAARAVAMTMEWLDGHGYGELCNGAITVINGVSKRSMSQVEQAELVVRGRCRAIVRVPWDDHLGAPPAEQGISDCLPAGEAESRFARLRPPVQLAYTALAGVLVSALAVDGRGVPPAPPRPPDGAPQRWAAR